MSVPPSYPTKSPLSTLSHPHAYTEHYLNQLPRYKRRGDGFKQAAPGNAASEHTHA